MATSKECLNYILEQLDILEEITYYPMMGEYVLYYRGKVIGGIYDDKLLVKNIPSAKEYMKDVVYQIPYEGAKEKILVTKTDDKQYLTGLFDAMYEELPEPKKKK